MDEIDISGLQVGGEGGGPLTADDILPMVARRDGPDEFAEEMVVLAGDPIRTWKITPYTGDAMRFAKGSAERVDCAELRASCEEDQVGSTISRPVL